MSKYKCVLESEVKLLVDVVDRNKRRFRSHKVMQNLLMFIRRYRKQGDVSKHVLLRLCENIYILCSRDIVNGFFLQFNMIVMGLIARIFYILLRIK